MIAKNFLSLVLVVPLAVINAYPQHQHPDMPEQLGSVQKSREFYRQLTTQCAASKSRRPELAHAMELLNKP
jgi:hypothetical protein